MAKVDQEEIYSPIRTEAKFIAVLVGALVIGVAFSVGFLWRGQYLKEERRSEEEIRKLNEDLQRRAVELEHSNKELEAFSYSVSHDVRTPLIGIHGLSGKLQDKYSANLDGKGQHFLRLIREETIRIDLINPNRD